MAIRPDPEKKIVFAKCKRGTDRMTQGQECDSLKAEQLSDPGSANVRFKCIKCNYLWIIPIGGSIEI